MNAGEARERAAAWLAADPDPQTQAELRDLLAQGADAELVDRFSASLEFGTAGLRGVLGAGPNRMNRAVVRRTTAGLARYLKAQVPDAAARGVVVGRDGRRLSRELAEDAAAVLAGEGIPVHYFEEVAPTPLTAFAVKHLGAAAGVMVTASHNPPEYNGYKVYWGNGAQIIPPHDAGIAAAIATVEPANQVRLVPRASAGALFRPVGVEVPEGYLTALLALLDPAGTPVSLKIVYTAMHGVGGRWAVELFRRAGRALIPVPEQQEPDGAFPTVRFPNPEEPGAMDLATALGTRERADLVLANDPDADRLAVMVADGAGRLVQLTGNEVGVLLGHFLLSRGGSGRRLVVTTIVSSTQLGQIAQAMGVDYAETLTGFKWIANQAIDRERATGTRFVFGYEEALGYSIGTVVRDKDGIGAALLFAELAAACAARGKTVLAYLEEIQRAHGLFVASQTSVTFSGADGAAAMKALMAAFRDRPPEQVGSWRVRGRKDYARGEGGLPASNVLAYELAGGGRITLRPSGTEPKVKYYFELKESPAAGEPIDAARSRAKEALGRLEAAFIALARDRGQHSGGGT